MKPNRDIQKSSLIKGSVTDKKYTYEIKNIDILSDSDQQLVYNLGKLYGKIFNEQKQRVKQFCCPVYVYCQVEGEVKKEKCGELKNDNILEYISFESRFNVR